MYKVKCVKCSNEFETEEVSAFNICPECENVQGGSFIDMFNNIINNKKEV